MEVYNEVTTKRGRFVPGGGCTSVRAAGGFLQGGGFGGFAKKSRGYPQQACLRLKLFSLTVLLRLQMISRIKIYFGLSRGAEEEHLDIVTKATLATYEMPNYIGTVVGTIEAGSRDAYEALLENFLHFYYEILNNEHWGEQVKLKPDLIQRIISLVCQGLSKEEVERMWQPFFDKLSKQSGLNKKELKIIVIPADKFWNYDYLAKHFPDAVKPYPGHEGMFYWSGDQETVLGYWYTYQSRWLPINLFKKENSRRFAKTLAEASRHAPIELHFNKGLAGAAPEALQRSSRTSINPVVLDSAALLICASLKRGNNDQPLEKIQKVNEAMKIITDATPNSGSYSNETDFFQKNWKRDFWGEHYPRLLEIKENMTPMGSSHAIIVWEANRQKLMLCRIKMLFTSQYGGVT